MMEDNTLKDMQSTYAELEEIERTTQAGNRDQRRAQRQAGKRRNDGKIIKREIPKIYPR